MTEWQFSWPDHYLKAQRLLQFKNKINSNFDHVVSEAQQCLLSTEHQHIYTQTNLDIF